MIHYLRSSILIWLLAFLSAEGSIAQQYAKMSPHLRQMTHARTRAKGAQKRMVMLVRGEESALSPYCVAHQGDLHLCHLSVDEAEVLSMNESVDYLQATPAVPELHLDTLSQIVGIDHVWNAYKLPQAYTGKGVLVGVADCGIDYTHPAFRDEHDGHLRIVRVWDKLDNPANHVYNAGSPFALGSFFSDPDKILAKHHSVDGHLLTHGTMTTSIAAGAPAGTPYRGVAYEADIYSAAVVCDVSMPLVDDTYKQYFTEEERLLTFHNIFAYADSVGQPCVISFSLGSSQDMTNEDAYIDEYLSRLQTPGHIVVASAGNNGREYHYLQKPADEESVGGRLSASTESSVINVATTGTLTMRVTGFVDQQPVSRDIVLDLKPGEQISASGLVCNQFSAIDTLTEIYGIQVQVYCGLDGFNPSRVGYDIFFNYPNKRLLSSEKTAVEFIGKNVAAEIFVQAGQLRAFQYADKELTGAALSLGSLSSPGALPSVIGVGATSHRTNWTRFDGVQRNYSDMSDNSGRRADFSSCGPSLHGHVKPDVVAPGVAVASAMNSVYLKEKGASVINEVVYGIEQDEETTYAWAVDRGTSFSTPVVAGIIALWLQADPTLTTERVREVFAKTCRRDDSMLSLPTAEPGVWPNNECGYGEIDAYRGLLEVLNLPENIPSLNMRQLTEAVVMPATDGNISVVFEAPVPHAVTCNVYALDGKLLCRDIIEPGTDKKTLQMQGTTGVVVVQLEGMGSTLCRL